MINNGKVDGRDKNGEALKKIQEQYGRPEEKSRDPVKKLGKDDFFRIMVTQLKNQDPTKPYDNEQMAAQMAQFTSLEQMFNMNANLEKLADNQKPLHQLGAAGLIGKWVTTDTSRVNHTEGKYSAFNFELPVDAQTVKIAIINEKGETVREIERSALKKGANSVDWDGRRSNNMQASSGTYVMQIRAESMQGKTVPVTTTNKSQVVGIGFEGKDTVLMVGDDKSPQKVLLRSISRVDSAPDAKPIDTGKRVEAVSTEGQKNQDSAEGRNFAKSDDRLVQDAEPGQAAKYSPIDMNVLKSLMGGGGLTKDATDSLQATKGDAMQAANPGPPKAQLTVADEMKMANPNAALIATGEKQGAQ